jgi:hypothetical protein
MTDFNLAKRAADSGNEALMGLSRLRKQREPALTIEQAFSRVYSDPANAGLVATYREADQIAKSGGQTMGTLSCWTRRPRRSLGTAVPA